MKKLLYRDKFFPRLTAILILTFIILQTGLTFSFEPNYYLNGLDLLENGNKSEASASFIRSIFEDKVIADYSLYRLFLISKDNGNITTCKKIAENFKNKYRKSRWYGEILYYLAGMYSDRKEYNESVKLYSEYLRISKEGSKKTDALLFLADALYKAGKIYDAKSHYLNIWKNYPSSSLASPAEEVLKKQFYRTDEIRDKFYLTTLHKRAQKIHKSYLYSKEISELDYIIKRQGNRLSDFLIKVYTEKGKALESLKEYRNAAKLYIYIAGRVKASRFNSKYPYFLYRQAYCYLQLSEDKKFLSLSKEITENYKSSPYAPRTFYLLYSFYKNGKDFKNAKDCLNKIIDSEIEFFNKSEVYWELGFLSYREGDYSTAINNFKKSSDASRSDEEQYSKAMFWAGKSAEKIKLAAYAETLFKKGALKSGYYGWMSQYRIEGHNNMSDRLIETSCNVSVSDDAKKEVESRWENLAKMSDNKDFIFYFRRSYALKNLGLTDDSLYELNEAVKRLKGINKDDVKTIALLFSRNGGYKNGIDYLRSKNSDSINDILPSDDIAKIVYPLVYYENIRIACSEFSISPFFVMALMRQESFFDPKALSYAGAAGLMQIMPATASRVTGTPTDRETLFNPLVNISIGVKYLSLLMKDNEDNPSFVLSAYNAGEKKTTEWRRKNINGDTEEFIENITYRETREYVKKVLKNYFYYMDVYCKKN